MNLTTGLYRFSVIFFGVYLAASLVAFWPRYLSNPGAVPYAAVHLHAWVMAAWLVLLFGQASLIAVGRRALHRAAGRLSYALAPAVGLALVLAAHSSISRGNIGQLQLAQLALQLSYVPLFALLYGLAMLYRKDRPKHARFMLCTVLPMTSPVFDRILGFYVLPRLSFLPRFVDGSRLLPLIYVVLIVLSALDWRFHRRKDVFPFVLLLFLAQHAWVLVAYRAEWWHDFGMWFAGVGLT